MTMYFNATITKNPALAALAHHWICITHPVGMSFQNLVQLVHQKIGRQTFQNDA